MTGTNLMPIEINSRERELLLEETNALIEQVREPQRARYVQLRDALETNTLDDDSAHTLEKLLALELQTGRVRKIHGPMVESTFLRLYQKTPTGAELQKSTNQVNAALAALQGQTIESFSFTPKGPGVFALALETDEYSVQLEIHPEGILVKQVELGN